MLPNFLAPIALLLALAFPQAPTPSIPDTPAGHVLQAWLDAFNSGDRTRIQAYIAKFQPDEDVDQTMSFREQTGGFELLAIGQNDRLHIQFQVKEKASPTTAIGKINLKDTLKDGDPPQVASLDLRAVPPGTNLADLNVKIDAATRARVIDGAIANLTEFYIFPDTAKKMGDAVRTHQKKGDYDSITDGDAFANKLTDDLREVSHDKHLRVNFSPTPLPKRQPGGPSPEERARFREQMERENCFFEKVERLPSNIGYVKFNGFMDPEICGGTAVAAMNFLGNSDAIIFDLRDNGGGEPRMIALLSSYLFDQPTHLNDLYNRKEDSTQQYWTLPYVPGKRLAGKPVFVLTSHRTFSGAEEFSYNLKNLKRATLVGETTGGGAHPVSGHPIDDHFIIGVPFARAINPISKTNWEGTGVEPDVKVPADQALETAKKLAADQIEAQHAKKE